MATATAVRPAVTGWTRRSRIVGWALLGCWLSFLVGVLLVVPRDATLDDLRDDLASGDVETIQVAGGLDAGPGHQGSAELRVQWRDHLLPHRVVALEVHPVGREGNDTVLAVVDAGVVQRLQAAHPHLRVERVPLEYPSFSSVVLGREVTGWIAWSAITLVLITLSLLLVGPEPWRATRWGWFWLFWLALPLGPVGYLLLGGPTGVVGRPRAGAGRLTGGWSFLLMLVALGPLSAALMARL